MFAGTSRASDGRQPSSATGRTCPATVASSPRAATGACATKIARQSKACVSTPPRAGPSAAPNVPVSVHTVAPRLAEPVSAPSAGSAPARSSAAPTPCTVRAATRNSRLSASAHAIEASRKTESPAARSEVTRTRCASSTRPKAATATAALYAVTTHETPVIVVSNVE